MIAYFPTRLHRVTLRMSLAQFALGTVLFLLLLIDKNSGLEIITMSFLGIATVVSVAQILILLTMCLLDFKQIEKHCTTIFISALNYPIAVLYISLIYNL